MKSVYLDLLIKIACAIGAVASLGLVMIYHRLGTSFDDKVYPTLLALSIIFLHWLAWELYYQLIGLPPSAEKKMKSEKVQMKSGWRHLISVGYVIIVLSVFNFYMSPAYAHAAEMVGFSLKLMMVGLLGQMAYVTRHLVSGNYKEERA